ncbi:TRAF-type zinc finger domain-containing protein 1-like protein [Tanacetum coccineum]
MKLMLFLIGIDDTYMQIRSYILSRETFPDVRSAYAIISNKESHRISTSNIIETSQRSQTSAFTTNVPNRGNYQRSQMANTDVELEQQLKEVGKKLLHQPDAVDELLPVLDQVERLLSKVDQSPKKTMLDALKPSMKALIQDDLLRHSDVDVKVAAASCMSEIMRITVAPDAPYDDDQMRDVFQLIVSSFEDLADQSSRSYIRRASILETVSKVRSCVIMLDLECDEMIVEMFEHFLRSVRDYHRGVIYSSMENIMILVLEESEDISVEILKPLLATVKKHNEGVLPIAQKLGEDVLKKSAEKLKPYLMPALTALAHTTSAPALSSPSTPSPQPTAQSPNDALMATMTQIANLLSGFQKQFPPTNNQLRTSSNSRTHATVHDGHIVTEPVQRKAPGNVGNTGARGKKVICYNCRGEGHVARQCKEPKRKMDSQYFKDKALLMEAKEKGDVLDAEAEAFLADVECTAPYDQPQALTTTNMFQANHEDAYDSDVDEGPNAAVAFMANLSSTSATNNPVNEVHSNDNQIFDNVDYQLSQEMHQEEHLDSDAETEIDDNTIPYHQYLLDTEAQNVPTEVSADTSDKVSMIAILTDLQTQLDGHAKVNQEKCLEIETLKNELLQCKQEICRLDTHKVKLDLENKVRQEQALVIQRNKRNAELVQENDLLKSTLSGKEKSIAFLQSEKEKILSEKKDLADSYLDEIVCLKNANKVARDMLQRFNMPTQTIPMLSKKPKAATADLHKDLLGTRNPGLGYMAKRAQPVLYDADTLLHPTHHPVSIWDSEEVLVHQVVSMKKMNEKPGHVRPANGFYDKLNALMFVPQKDLSGDQAYWLSANEIASQASKPATPATPFVHKSRPPSQVLASLQKVNAVFHQFEGIIKERTTQKPDYVSEWCYDYAKQFVEQWSQRTHPYFYVLIRTKKYKYTTRSRIRETKKPEAV